MRCTGVILAGGEATRYGGQAKGLERVGGVRIIDRVADALRATCDDLLLIANRDDAGDWLPGVPVAPDVREGEGSLGGIHAALARAGTPVVVVAWDMPFVPAALLGRLRTLGEAGHDAALPQSDSSRRGVEPMCAWYAPACLGAIERRLEAGDRRVVSFFGDVRVAILPLEEVRVFGDPDLLFMNVNTPGELDRAEAHAASTAARDRRA